MNAKESSFDHRGGYFVPLWLERLFWVTFVVHFIVSSLPGSWFAASRGTILSCIKFVILVFSYTIVGCAFHAACNIPRPSVISHDPSETVRDIVKTSFINGFLVAIPLTALSVWMELEIADFSTP
jgi:hypothetical protein